jgi:hypothetical protein
MPPSQKHTGSLTETACVISIVVCRHLVFLAAFLMKTHAVSVALHNEVLDFMEIAAPTRVKA